MVFLSKIYTKSGDKGDTGLGDGTRVPKDHPRVTAYGSVDELNSVLGLLLAHAAGSLDAETQLLQRKSRTTCSTSAPTCACRKNLRRSRADRCACGPIRPTGSKKPSICATNISNRSSRSSCPAAPRNRRWCHLARTVCRRAERDVVTLMRGGGQSAGAHLSQSIVGFVVCSA